MRPPRKNLRLAVFLFFLPLCGFEMHAAWSSLLPPSRPTVESAPIHSVFFEKWFKKKAPPSKEPPAYKINTDEAFKAQSRTRRIRPKGEPALEIEVTIPTTWSVTEIEPDNTSGMGKQVLTTFVSIQSEMISVHQMNMTIASQPLQKDISAEDWLKHFILSNGYSLEKEVLAEGPLKASAAYSSIDQQEDIFTYASAQINGGFLVLTRASLPRKLKSYMRYIQPKVVDSLEFLSPISTPIEPQKSYSLINVIRFLYPESWNVLGMDLDILSRPSVELQTKGFGGTIDGFIRIQAVKRESGTNLLNEIELLKKHFSDYLGIEVKSMNKSISISGVHNRFIFSRLETYKAAYKKDNHIDPEVTLAVLGDQEWYILAYMISPRGQDNLVVAAQDARALDLLLKSIR